MNVRGRNPSGIRLPESALFKLKSSRKPYNLSYKFKINNASYLNVVNNNLESAEKKAKRSAKRTKNDLGTVTLISITKQSC